MTPDAVVAMGAPIIPAVSHATDTGTIRAVSAATRQALPPPCVDCVFWQHRRASTDPEHKDRWVRGLEAEGGVWGRMLVAPEGARAMIQYGPAAIFPRARRLPAGPPSRDAALITCVYLGGDDPAGTYERLALECLADLKARGADAVEAFARRATFPRSGDALAGHHTLMDRDLLERLGFGVRRERGAVALMRLRLGGLVAAPASRQGLLERLGFDPPAAPAAQLGP